MKNIHKIIAIGILSLFFISAMKIDSNPIDYLSVGKNIEFNEERFELKWSSHPSPDYYKQEYLRKDDKLPNYEKMIMVEAVKGNIPVSQVANGKIAELENWKKSNPIINYQKSENKEKNEIILDFILSDGQNVYEWNVYRYQNQHSNSENYLVLYSYSYRNYVSNKEQEKIFLTDIENIRNDLINKVEVMELPNVKTK